MNIPNMCDYVPHERILFELGAPIQEARKRYNARLIFSGLLRGVTSIRSG